METNLRPGALPAVLAVILALVLTACTAAPGPDPDRSLETADSAIEAVRAGLESGDLAAAPVDDPQRAAADLEVILQGMDGFLPQVSAGEPREVGSNIQVTYRLEWDFDGSSWAYDSIATFTHPDGSWQLQWEPKVVHPELTSRNRLVHKRIQAARGKLLGAGGVALAELMPVVRVGIDKARMDDEQAASAAARLAKALEIDVDNYVERVAASGEKAFVEALVLRGSRQELPGAIYDIPGVLLLDDELVLSTRKGRAAALVGVVGDATKERVEASDGAIAPGDRVGLSGLQLRYDESLRGVPGHTVTLAERPDLPSPSPSASAPESSTSNDAEDPEPLFTADPQPGKDLTITLDPELQDAAEAAIADHDTAVAVAIVQPSTGAVRALATNQHAEGQQLANFGRYAPGSTFKIATALALLRAGLTPDSSLECSEFITVGGRQFKNYSDFPPSRIGPLSLTDSIATSCNTALISQHDKLSGEQLREAAISLGVGADHDAGFPAFYGEVPDPEDVVALAASEIGQAKVEASPMAMAGMAASVAAGQTVVPWLIDGQKPTQKGKPLTSQEAEQLRQMMGEAVRSGTARSLQGVVSGAKTGTAEYGTDDPPQTNAWMIAYTDDDLAIAVFVADGASGAGDAAPVIEAILS